MSAPRALPAHQAPTRRLASWRPTTLREWPGHIAASLRLSGCTFTCPGCNASSYAAGDEPVRDWADIVRHLRADSNSVEGVLVTGGEPTDDPDLPSLLAALKELGTSVRIDTNGSRPDVLAFLLAEALVDSVALDVKALPARYRSISQERDMPARVAESAQLLIASGIDHQFRTTLVPGIVEPTDLPHIARTLQGGRQYVIQQFVPPAGVELIPYPDEVVTASAEACRRFLPTIVRGIDPGED